MKEQEEKIRIKRIIQIVQHLLSKYNYRLNYTKLLKLLYLADRQALQRWDTRISKDTYANMRQGPVLSGLYNLIKEDYHDQFAQGQWTNRFYRDGHDLVAILPKPLPVDELSSREIELLDQIDAEYHEWTFSKLIDLLHDEQQFPEWENPENSSTYLSLRTILHHLDRTDEEIQVILEDERCFEADIERSQQS